MPKKIKFESFKYRFLIAAKKLSYSPVETNNLTWRKFLNQLFFEYDNGKVLINSIADASISLELNIRDAKFYTRGDEDRFVSRQKEQGLITEIDSVKLSNSLFFDQSVIKLAELAGYTNKESNMNNERNRHDVERDFHDAWAESENLDSIDVVVSNEACTAPEMRFITARLGTLAGKKLLDVGCGLGEASVYFALKGAEVTSSDLSQGMLDATTRLATSNGVTIKPHLSAAEDLKLPSDALFDVIYMGNLLHHVDIDETLTRVKNHLSPTGVLVTWDPLAYNPAINIYRNMATDVRTDDEHPLRWSDIKLFNKHFSNVERKYFWFSTLIIFVLMYLVQRKNPNKERFWKVVVQEGEQWKWLYVPLEIFDKLLLALIPPLRLLCWNIVLVAKSPRK